MKKSTIISIIFGILAITWMIVIYCFSARPADQSTEDSHHIGMVIGQIVHSDFESWTPEEQLAFAQKVDHPVRKAAHATEYAILAVLLFWSTEALGHRHENSIRKNGKSIQTASILWIRTLLACVLSAIYAGTDEYHQLFVPGRSGQFSDVCIDSLGAVVGLSILIAITFLYREGKKRAINKKDINKKASE